MVTTGPSGCKCNVGRDVSRVFLKNAEQITSVALMQTCCTKNGFLLEKSICSLYLSVRHNPGKVSSSKSTLNAESCTFTWYSMRG